MGHHHLTGRYRNALGIVLCLAALCVHGCAGGIIEEPLVEGKEVDQPGPVLIDPPGSVCQGLTLATPQEGAFIPQSAVLVTGSITSREPTSLIVDGIDIQAEGGEFEVMLEKDDGTHTIEIVCDQSRARRVITVGSGVPQITIESPASGALIDDSTGVVTVSGSVSTAKALRSLQFQGQHIQLDAQGRFTLEHRPSHGMNHLDIVGTTIDGEVVDLRRSFIYGRFTPWTNHTSAMITADVRASAIHEVSKILEQRLSSDAMEEIFDEQLGTQGKLTIRDIRYDRLELNFELQEGRIGVRLALHDFAISARYRENSFLQASGWIRSNPVRVRADLVLNATGNGGYDLRLENPEVRLSRFDLDLNGIASLFEGLVEPMVRDIARKTLLDALDDIVIEDLLTANLLDQEIEFLGQSTQLTLAVDALRVTPNGIGITTHARMAPFEPVHQAPGFWTSSPSPRGVSGSDHLALGMSVDLFNRVLGEAWRGGLLDVDLATLIGDENPLSVALLNGVVGPSLLEHFPATATVQLDSKALMQPIARVENPESGQIAVEIGALEIRLSSETEQGELKHWATLEVSLDLDVQPRFSAGEFTMGIGLATRIELVETPLFPIADAAFETFLETIIEGISSSTLNELADSAFNFGDIDILGIGVGSVNFGSAQADPGFLVLGINLAARN